MAETNQMFKHCSTRMHSGMMRTARSLTIRVEVGLSAQKGVCPRGVSARGSECVSAQGVWCVPCDL